MKRRHRRRLAIDVDRNNRDIVVRCQVVQRHHNPVIEFPFLAVADIDVLHYSVNQLAGNFGVSRDFAAANA